MRGVHLLAYAVLVGAVIAQECPVTCGASGTCTLGSDGQYMCDCNAGYYGQSCENSVCQKMLAVTNNIPVCSILRPNTPCTGDISGGKLCDCPSNTSGVLCDGKPLAVAETLCLRRQRLNTFILALVNTSMTVNGTMQAMRYIVNTSSLKSALQDIGLSHLSINTCDSQGKFEPVQCEVDINNLTSRQCYCADPETGRLMQGHSKMTTKPTNCPVTEVNKCEAEPQTGMCRGYMPKWFYNSTSSRCEKFIYGGCQGNDNKFETAEECYSACNPEGNLCVAMPSYCETGKTCVLDTNHTCDRGKCNHWPVCKEVNKCEAKPETGMCRGYMPKWFYNSTSSRCEKFIYGGCQGNDNKFETAEECYNECNPSGNPCAVVRCMSERKCVVAQNSTCDKGKCSHWADCREVNKCEAEPETGMCRGYMPKWFYNSTSSRCEKFIYGGCQGNDNKFETAAECYNECKPSGNPCATVMCMTGLECAVVENTTCDKGNCSHWSDCTTPPVKEGDCPSSEGMMGICMEGCTSDSSCQGDMKCCSNGCGHVCMNPVQTQPKVKPGQCPKERPHSGQCIDHMNQCSHDGDCQDNYKCCMRNCDKVCVPPDFSHIPSECKVSPLGTSMMICMAYIPSWFYNHTTGRCEMYIYGGCHPSTNHFRTVQQCYDLCNKEANPCKNVTCSGSSVCTLVSNNTCQTGSCSHWSQCKGISYEMVENASLAIEWRPAYYDKQSKEYKKIYRELSNSLAMKYSVTPSFVETIITRMLPGSLSLDYKVRYSSNLSEEERTSVSNIADEIKQKGLKVFDTTYPASEPENCVIPSDYIGEWFSVEDGVDVNTSVVADSWRDATCARIRFQNKAYGSEGVNSTLLLKSSNTCFMCVEVLYRTQNILQIRQSACFSSNTGFESMCQGLSQRSQRTLFRKYVQNVNCYPPINGRYQFSYEISLGNGGVCDNPNNTLSTLESGTMFDISFKLCSDVTTSMENNMRYKCMGSWYAMMGDTQYLFAAVANNNFTVQDKYKYKCLMTKENQMNFDEEHWVMSEYADCSRLNSLYDGPFKLVLRKKVNNCEAEPETGMCRGYMPKWFYNSTSSRCEKFIYGGCQGNDNKFETVAECYSACNPEGNLCVAMPSYCERGKTCVLDTNHTCNRGKCNHWPVCKETNKTGQCPEPGVLCVLGCSNDMNCTGTQKCCNGCCQEPSVTAEVPEKCKRSPLPTPGSISCLAYIPHWFYNDSTSRCEKYIYGGCNPSENDFDSAQQCYSECNESASPCAHHPCGEGRTCRVAASSNCSEGKCHHWGMCRPLSCSLTPETGRCRGNMPMWFYNQTSSQCEKFIYGGCGGNMNKYETAQTCYDDCNPGSNPCASVNCDMGQKCTLKYNMNCTKGYCPHFPECRVANKSGSCPASDGLMQIATDGECRNECSGDHECHGNRKCCYHGCSMMCLNPDVPVNPCSEGRTMCRGVKKCVANVQLCDGHNDCGDWSDEHNCTQGNTTLAECRNLLLNHRNDFVETLQQCMTSLIHINTSVISNNDTCSLYNSLLKCAVMTMKRHKVGCSYMEFHKELAAHIKTLEAAGTAGNFPHVFMCADHVPTGNQTVAGLCEDDRLLTVLASATICISRVPGIAACSVLSSATTCLRIYSKCSATYIVNALINNTEIIKRSHNLDFSVCLRPSGQIYKYNSYLKLDMPWSSDLYDSSSYLYRSLKRQLENFIGPMFISVGDLERFTVTGFWPGSVQANTTAEFTAPLTESKMVLVKQVEVQIENSNITIDGQTYSFIKTATDKPGECPSVVSAMGTCVESCSADSDCAGSMKCCSNGCGHTCQHPQNVTETKCIAHYECSNGGTCFNGQCMCARGFYGVFCNYQKEPCASSPCMNGGTCMTPYHHDNYTCACPSHTFGSLCEKSVCDMLSADACRGNYSYCTGDVQGWNLCQCQYGRTGIFCEVQSSSASWGCEKQLQFAKYMQKVLNGQATFPLNYTMAPSVMNLLRQLNVSSITIPTCSEIPSFYSSPSCDMDINTQQMTCYCVDKYGLEQPNTRKALYLGQPNCSDPCEINPCLNGGTCNQADFSRNTTCSCAEGFTGDRCQISFCSQLPFDPCTQYGGRCIGNLTAARLCDCSTVYTSTPMSGIFCDAPGDDSQLTYCQRQYNLSVVAEGILNGSNSLMGTSGLGHLLKNALIKAGINMIQRPYCDASGRSSVICNHNVANMSYYECFCTDGRGSVLFGTRNSVNQMPEYCPAQGERCADFECQHNSSCYDHGDRSYCYCPYGYSGKNCEKYDGSPCNSNPCKNGFACRNLYAGSYSCNCSAEWGPDCSMVPTGYCNCRPMERCVWFEDCDRGECNTKHKCVGYDYTGPCDRMPCGQNGKCIERGPRDYKCDCYPDYRGVHCQVNYVVCQMFGIEMNRICGTGTCVGDIAQGKLCQCPPGRRGAFCERSGDATTLCQHQSDLYRTAIEIVNGSLTIPGLQNATDIARAITRKVMGSSEIPLVNCTPSGEFAPQQCNIDMDTFSKRCYCVNSAGVEVYQNITMLPGQPPCTSPDPKDIAKMLCENLGASGLCMNGGTCVGELDSTPKLCACAEGYEGIMCERRAESGEEAEDYTMCTFSLDMYKLMKSIMSGNITLSVMGITIDRNLLMSSYYRLMMASALPNLPVTVPGMPDNLLEVSNSTTGLELAILRPNCTSDGHFNSTQCEYGLMTGDRHACYCFTRGGKLVQGTRTMPPAIPDCSNVTDTCEKIHCPMECPSGYRKNMLGCEICECKDVCDGRTCPLGMRCKNVRGRSACIQTHKKGMCPMEMMANIDSLVQMFEDTMDTCEMTCRDDADCEGDMKCCGTCGNRCVKSYFPANCDEKKEALEAHWQLYQNLTSFLKDKAMTDMASRSYPAVLHSAITWVRETKTMWQPSCDSDGNYERVQCMYNLKTANKEVCYCSDSEGRRINGTDEKAPTMPSCKVKPGYCPMAVISSPASQCSKSCSEDYDCAGHDKCCTIGCSSSCQSGVQDNIQEHAAKVARMFSQLCGLMTDNICEHGSQCVANWTSGEMCKCPDGYKGPVCSERMSNDEQPPSVCQKRRAIYKLITDSDNERLKNDILMKLEVSSVVMNRANCTDDGFAPVQCDYDINSGNKTWCYCVNKMGWPIPGSRVHGSKMPQCGAMMCEAGYPLYAQGEAENVMCDNRPCPAGYECKHIAYGQKVCCISPHGHRDICQIAASPGKWCEGRPKDWSTRYTYNAVLGQCVPFQFRGCHGNQNNFETKEKCTKRCSQKDKEGRCPLVGSVVAGRYCQQSCSQDSKCPEDKKCCPTDCGHKCITPKSDDDSKVCKLGVQYRNEDGSPFHCGRGQPPCPEGYVCKVDPADGPSFCCLDENKPVNICHQPKQKGPCEAIMHRYFFNKDTKQCEKFVYGGCQGNDNNFQSLEECCQSCGSENRQCKPGVCPKPTKNYLLPCKDKCSSDRDCLGNSRCCYNGCGMDCILPAIEVEDNCHTMRRKAHLMLKDFEREETCPMIVIPRCNKDGTWQSQQCLDGFGICWCVDTQGNKIEKSVTRGHANCQKFVSPPKTVRINMENNEELTMTQVCPQETRIHCCNPSLCQLHTCRAHPSAVCRVNPCDGCRAEFFDKDNNVVNCTEGLSTCELHQHRAKTAKAQNLFNKMPSFADKMGKLTERMMDEMMPEQEEPTSIPSECQAAPDESMCSDALERMWFYNHKTDRCERFTYGGCGKNLNRFDNVEQCYQTCNILANPCQMKNCGEGQECHLAVDKDCEEGQCAHWAECRYIHRDPHFSGINVPTCNKYGYERKQCHHGYCWCVDTEGKPVIDSLSKEDGLVCNEDGSMHTEESKILKCENGRSPNLRCVDSCLGQVCPGKPHATCVVNLCSDSCDVKFMEGKEEVYCNEGDKCDLVYAEPPPTCSVKSVFCAEGEFPKICSDKCKEAQCPNNPCAVCQMDKCTCEAVFTDMLTHKPVTDCNLVTHTRCEISKCNKLKEQHAEMLTNRTSSVLVPNCTESGHYIAKQCRGDMCWCVDGNGNYLRSLPSSKDACKWNETVEVMIRMKFDEPYSIVQGKETQFISAFKLAINNQIGIPHAEQYIQDVRVSKGSILVETVLADHDSNIPSPQVALLADILENRIIDNNMTVEFEGKKLTAKANSISRSDRFEQEQPVTTTPEPEPEAEPTLDTHSIIIIAVVCSVAGLIILGILCKCICCRNEKKEVLSETSPDFIHTEKQMYQNNMAVSNATYGIVKAPMDNLVYTHQTDIIKKPIDDNLYDGDVIKVRL